MRTINDTGREEIRSFLADNHQRAAGGFSTAQIDARVREAEFSLAEGNDASIELWFADSVHGHTQTFYVSPAGIDEQDDEAAEEEQESWF